MKNATLQKQTNMAVVPMQYYEMFGLRIIGLTYKQIADKTGYSETWVRTLFMSKNKLGELWNSWLEKAKADNVEESMNMMFGHLPDIVRANIVDAKSLGTPVAVAARKMIFDHTLGKPVEKIKFDGRLGIYNFADWIKSENEQRENNAGVLSEESD